MVEDTKVAPNYLKNMIILLVVLFLLGMLMMLAIKGVF